jgi:hypothetical protein
VSLIRLAVAVAGFALPIFRAKLTVIHLTRSDPLALGLSRLAWAAETILKYHTIFVLAGFRLLRVTGSVTARTEQMTLKLKKS